MVALTNAEHQARWRERNIARRRIVAQLANILNCKTPDDRVDEVAALLRQLYSARGTAALSKALTKSAANKANEARLRKGLEGERKAWLHEHPGMAVEDYWRLFDTDVIAWRKAIA